MNNMVKIFAILALAVSIVAIVAIVYGQQVRIDTNEIRVKTEYPVERKEK